MTGSLALQQLLMLLYMYVFMKAFSLFEHTVLLQTFLIRFNINLYCCCFYSIFCIFNCLFLICPITYVLVLFQIVLKCTIQKSIIISWWLVLKIPSFIKIILKWLYLWYHKVFMIWYGHMILSHINRRPLNWIKSKSYCDILYNISKYRIIVQSINISFVMKLVIYTSKFWTINSNELND